MERPMQAYGPERPGGQGLDSNQEESGNRAIVALLADAEVRDHVDLVVTYRDEAYEVWAARGMVRFRRLLRDDGTIAYEIVEQCGENPIARQDHRAVSTCAAELEAAGASGHPSRDPNAAFLEPAQLTYPCAYERIAQLFDSPNAPDLVVSPKAYAFGRQPGQHGALDAVQSRGVLAFAGPGIRPGAYEDPARHVDIAPTICALMGFPLIDGKDPSGRRASDRGVPPDVYLERQDGQVLRAILAGGARPRHVYLLMLDGLSNSELTWLLEQDHPAVRNLRRLLDRSARFRHGSVVTFPSITWPSHGTVLTGVWSGHHDIVNPSYYLRAERAGVSPQGQGLETDCFLSRGVETLYEAFRRALGPGAFTAAVHVPQGRGADHAALERRVVAPRDRLKALTAEATAAISPRWRADGHEAVHREAVLDARGAAQVRILFDDPSHPMPAFIAHEFSLTDGAGHEYGPHGDGLREAVAETDRRLGNILDLLAAKGVLETTLFVVASDHGMAAQDTALMANPARHPERIGLKALTCEPMIWLRDLAVEVEPAPDGRSARVTVRDNDADGSGEGPPIAGAEILVHGPRDTVIARTTTNAAGIAGFGTPVDERAADIALAVRHPDFNPRHLRLDGTNLAIDPRAVLYGARVG